ncbi:energy transducer TonB [Nitrogeniibacter mangrovi]|nr:energy transducer TonB [Nitrogeniibacter mangrovi]
MVTTTLNLRPAPPTPAQRLSALGRLLVVVGVHAALFTVIAMHMDVTPPKPPETIEVALLAPPAPAPVAPPPKVETPPEPPKPVPPPPEPVVRKPPPPKPQPKPKPKPKPRPQPKQAITEPTPEPTPPEPEVAPAPPPPPVAVAPTQPTPAPAPAPAAPPPVTSARFDAAYLNNPRPGYPRLSRRMGEQGTVQLRVHVSAEGTPLDIELHHSSGHKRLDEAARAAVAHWRFVPARRGDTPVASWVIVPIEFKLEDA